MHDHNPKIKTLPSRLITGLVRRFKMLSRDRHVRENKGQLLYGYLPEVDFELFALLDGKPGLVIDAGANRGHCALAVLQQTLQLSVYSFEPNPALLNALKFIKTNFPGRFQFKTCGLGKNEQTRELHIPLSNKGDVSANASFRLSEFEKDYVQKRLADETGLAYPDIAFRQRPVEILTLDSFDLVPIAIKVDVEGMEQEVLAGAERTISKHRPMIMVELNNHSEFLPGLQQLGYAFYYYEADAKVLRPLSDTPTCLNIICLHPQSTAMTALSKLLGTE